MFEASHPFAFFDYFRVPYEVSPTEARRLASLKRLRLWAA